MITLITGSPGGGKTLYCVSKVIPPLLADGRVVYTNIKDLNYTEVKNYHGVDVVVNKIKIKDNKPIDEVLKPLPDSLDWRDLPHGSVIIYDEAQQFFPTTGGTGLSNDGRISDLDTHRHKGYDIFYITQHPTLINSHIRKFVGHHVHLYRKWGARNSIIYEWNHCISSPENLIGDAEKYNRKFFYFNKKAFSFYKSSEIHTVKFRLPRKLFMFLALFIVLFGGVGYFAYTTINNVSDLYSGVNNSNNVLGSLPKSSSDRMVCSIVGDSCTCSDSTGLLDVPVGQCVSNVISTFGTK